jgi:DNA uptake protein ComE-like DNA-binding protein
MIVLATILAGVLTWHAFLPRLVSTEPPDMLEYEPKIREFKARQAHIRDSLNRKKQLIRKPSSRSSSITPFPFDPNNLPAKQWRAMGLSEKQVQVIKNYERKGGSFQKPEDLKKIYSLSNDTYEKLLPYIRIKTNNPEEKKIVQSPKKEPSRVNNRNDTTYIYGQSQTTRTQKSEHLSECFVLSINTADTLDLQRLPGIGPVFSRRICSYRTLLGGYANKEQLLEVYGMDSSRFLSLQEYIFIDTSLIERININQSLLKPLMRHPYIDFALAKMIVTERGKNGKYNSLEDVRKRLHLPENTFLKITPYIGFK